MKRHYRITAPHFVAGVTVDFDGQYIRTAPPILAWACGRDWLWFRDYAARKRWTIVALEVE